MRQALASDEPVASGRAEPERVENTESAPSSSAGRPSGGTAGTIGPSSIHTKAEFYQWFSAMEATRASEVEAKYKHHAEAVERQIEVCNELLGDIGSVLDIFSELKLSQRAISGRTDALKEQCDRLVSEREKLTTVSGSIKERLDHFDRLEELSSLFHAPVSASSDPHAILKGLEDLDTSLSFTSKHPEYLESAKYHAKFRNLQARAMALVKSYFQESVAVSIAECKASTLHDADDGSGQGKGQEDGGDMTIQNVKFRAIAESRLQELMSGVCSHSDRPTYEQLIKDCSTAYCKARFELVRYGVLAAMQKLTAQGNVLDSMTTSPAANSVKNPEPTAGAKAPPNESTSPTSGGQVASTSAVDILTGSSNIVSRTAEAEIQLYRHIFPGSSHARAAAMLSPLFDSMCILLAAVIEPVIYSTLDGDVQGLCRLNAQLVRLMRHETLGAVFNVPSLNKLVQVVERMIVRQAKSDWKKILAESSALRTDGVASPLAALLEPADMDFLGGLGVPLDGAACRAHRNPKAFEPVVRGVQMITAMKESVGGRSALELIGDIVPGLLDVVHRVSEHSVPSGSSDSTETSEAYGAIFALRQLSLLYQCLDSTRVADLDLGDHGNSADGGTSVDGETTGGKKRGFVSSLSSRIPLLASFSSLTSRTMQGGSGPSGADIVATLEKKSAIARDFCILTCAQDATNPLLSFLTKVTAAKVSGREQIKSHAFATLERVKQLAADVRDAIHGPLLRHIALLHMVMPEPELSTVLEAVRANLEDALTQMQDIVTAEYTAEEAQSIGWVSYEETLKLLFEKRATESSESD